MSKSISPKSLDTPLKSLLEGVGSGRLQLPAFQRGWRWDEERIRRLIASLTLGYPMGAVMLLEHGGEAKFGTRLFEGVHIRKPKPERLVLDGQQRLTSLWRAMCSREPVLMPGEDAKDPDAGLYFYLDVVKCLDESADRMDAVVAVPGSRIEKRHGGLDLSAREKEFAAGMFPLNVFFEPGAPERWFIDWLGHHGYAPERKEEFSRFSSEILAPVAAYTIPAVTLARETPAEAVCQVFENVNTGGVPLTVFELEAASFAAEDDAFDLRADWEKHVRPAIRGEGEPLATDVLHGVDEKDFLTAVTLLASHERNAERAAGGDAAGSSCKKKDVLALSLADYRKYRDRAVEGFRLARNFLLEQRVFRRRDLPYATQVIPLAAACADAGASVLDHPKAAAVLARWYWSGVLGEMYNGPIETRYANDMDDLCAALKAAAAGKDGALPPIRTADAAFFSAPRLLTMRSRNSAAYKGVMALIYMQGGLDFRKGIPMDAVHAMKDAPDVHHIFPKQWCLASGDPDVRAKMDSIVNKTPLLPASNMSIGGAAPRAYAEKIMKEAEIGEEELRARIESHLVDWDAFMAGDFRAHFIYRAKKLLDLVEDAMGRKVADRGSVQTVGLFGASLEDGGPGSSPEPPASPAPEPAPAEPPSPEPAVPADRRHRKRKPAWLFAALRERVLAFGGVEVRQPDGSYASFFAGKGRFLAAARQKGCVKVYVVMKGGQLDDPQGLTAPGNQDGESIMYVRDEAELEAAVPLARQAYDAAAAGTAEAEAALFGDAAPNVCEAWKAVKSGVLALGGAVSAIRGGYAFFALAGRVCLACEPQKRSLKLYLDVPAGKLADPDGMATLMQSPPWHGVGDYKAFAADASEAEALMPLVRQSLGVAPAEASEASLETPAEGMGKHGALTAFLPRLEATGFGTEEGRKLSGELHSEVYRFAEAHKDEAFINYPEALEKAGVWKKHPGDGPGMDDPLLLASLDGTAVMAMVWGAASQDRVSEGLFDARVESGCMAKWLRRLREIDEAASGGHATEPEGARPAGESAMDEEEAVRLWSAVKEFAKDRGREPSVASADPSERHLAEALAFMRRLKAQRRFEEQETEGTDGSSSGAPAAPSAEDALLAGSSPEVAGLYASLKERFLALGGVSAEPRKHYVSFRADGRIFLSASFLKSRIRLFLNMKKGTLDDPDGLAEDVSARGHWGPGDYQADAADEAGLEALMPLVRQAYGAVAAKPSEPDRHGAERIDRTAAEADREARELGFSRAEEMGRTDGGQRVFLYVAEPGCPNYGAVIGPPLFVVEAGDGELRMPSAEEEREFTVRFLKTEKEDEDGEETDYEEEIPEAAEESGALGRGRESISAE